MRTSTAVFLLLLGAAVATAQSPWTRSKAGFYLQASGNFIPTYTTLFDEVLLPREVSEGTFQLYGEYGFSKHTTVVADLPFRFLKTGDPVAGSSFQNNNPGSLSAPGNVGLAIRHSFSTQKFALAASLKTALPTGQVDDATGLRSDYDALTVTPMLSIGKGWNKTYAFAYGGYGFRSNDFCDVVNAGLEAGYKAGPVWIVGFSELVIPVENEDGPASFPGPYTGLYVNNQGWVSIGVKGIWAINRFTGIVVSGAGAVWARNVPQSPGLGLGAYFKWD